MHHNIVVFSLLLFFTNAFCQDQDLRYCDLYPLHTLCIKPFIGEFCHEFKQVIPNKDHQEKIVHWHNRIRQKVALGLEKRNSLPSAANMMKMKWDDELATIAQRAANQCLLQHDCKKCRGALGRRFEVGQSIAFRTQTTRDHFDFMDLIKSWYDKEVSLIPEGAVESYYSNNAWDRYSQLIWWNTRLVGCGGSSYKSSIYPGNYYFLVFCNYGVSGNIHSAMIYSKGEKCIHCPKDTNCDRTYDGLCAVKE